MELPSSGSQIAFRLMNDDDIRQFLLLAFDFKLDRDAFARPTREMVFSIYKRFVTALLPKDVEQPKLEAAQQMYDLGLHLENIQYMNLTHEINKILRGWDDQKFQASDIGDPKRKRTQHFLTVLITVWGYIYDDVHPKWQATSKEKGRLQLRDRNIQWEKQLAGTTRRIEEVAVKISDLEASNGSREEIDSRLGESETKATKKKTAKEESRKKMNETRLGHAKLKEAKSDIKLATNKLKERRIELEKMSVDFEERIHNYQKEVEIQKSLQSPRAVLQTIENQSEWDDKQLETCLALTRSAKNPLMIKTSKDLEQIVSYKSLIGDKKHTIEFNKAQITEESTMSKMQLEEIKTREQTAIQEKEAIRSKVELAFSGFEKTMDESIDVISGPLKTLK